MLRVCMTAMPAHRAPPHVAAQVIELYVTQNNTATTAQTTAAMTRFIGTFVARAVRNVDILLNGGCALAWAAPRARGLAECPLLSATNAGRTAAPVRCSHADQHKLLCGQRDDDAHTWQPPHHRWVGWD